MFKKLITMALLTVGIFAYDLDKAAEYAYYDYQAEVVVENRNLNKSVVIVQNGGGHGTGFFIRKNIIITNYHVVATRDKWTGKNEGVKQEVIIQTYDGNQYIGRVMSFDADMDLAMISIKPHIGIPLEIDTNRAPIGTRVFMLGNGGFEFFHVSSGTVGRMYPFAGSNWNNNQQLLSIYAIGGFSGSAVIDMYTGKVVGVICGGASDPSADLGIMISAPDLLKFIENTKNELIEKIKKLPKDKVENNNLTQKSSDSIIKTKVILSMLLIPRAAIDKDMELPIAEFCIENEIQFIINDDTVIFRGKSELLTMITNYVFAGKELK